MSQLDPQRFSTEEFPDQVDWIGKLFSPLNQFTGDVVRAFRNQLTISDNLYQEIKEKNIKIIKVFSVDNQEDNQKNSKINNDFMAEYAPFCEYFLFDTKGTNHGGTGVKFNWQILENYILKTPFLLSGGITADDIDEIKNIKHQQFVGIDINSKFEIKAGLKDIEMIKNFIENLKK